MKGDFVENVKDFYTNALKASKQRTNTFSFRNREQPENLNYDSKNISDNLGGVNNEDNNNISNINSNTSINSHNSSHNKKGPKYVAKRWWNNLAQIARKYGIFIGPGMMVSVAYIDPGNYSTDEVAGASYRFKLLFVVFLSNVLAIFLQSLCVKLGSVTGKDLATNCREHFPRWMTYMLYAFAEICIIATDLAEVIGTAIALKILLHIPLPAGVVITIVDVLLVLFAYKPESSANFIRIFEYSVAFLVIGVAICFMIELSHITHLATVQEVFKGYLPSRTLIEGEALVQGCGILGATVMPHSLFLGSGLVQPRLREYDEAHGNWNSNYNNGDYSKYRPSIGAFKYAFRYSIIELALSLFTFALFINSAILIVSGATLYNTPGASDADLFDIYDLLHAGVSKGAAIVFALALLLSGLSAGIVCTIAGQMVSEGFLNWTVRPWLRRLITRSIAIIPCLAIACSLGREGMNVALNASQDILSILLPIVSAPLIYFTAKKSIMYIPKAPISTVEYNDSEMELNTLDNRSETNSVNTTNNGAESTSIQTRDGKLNHLHSSMNSEFHKNINNKSDSYYMTDAFTPPPTSSSNVLNRSDDSQDFNSKMASSTYLSECNGNNNINNTESTPENIVYDHYNVDPENNDICDHESIPVGKKFKFNPDEHYNFANHWTVSVCAFFVWLFISFLNITLIVFLCMGKS